MRGRENAARAAAVYSYAAMALLGAVITIVNSTQGRLSEHYGVPANRITLLISCIGVGRLLIQVVCGALSDRFGLIINYRAPNQNEYLAIIDYHLRANGVILPPEELRILGQRWEMEHSGRNGRTARQFVAHYLGQMKDAKTTPQ